MVVFDDYGDANRMKRAKRLKQISVGSIGISDPTKFRNQNPMPSIYPKFLKIET